MSYRSKEKLLEQQLHKAAVKAGGTSYKWVSPGQTGVPDRIVITPRGHTIFVEVKDPYGELSKRQEYIINKLTKLGVDVRVVRSKECIDCLIADFFTS